MVVLGAWHFLMSEVPHVTAKRARWHHDPKVVAEVTLEADALLFASTPGSGGRGWSLGLRVWGLGFRLQGLGFEVWGLGIRVWGLGFDVWDLGLGI